MAKLVDPDDVEFEKRDMQPDMLVPEKETIPPLNQYGNLEIETLAYRTEESMFITGYKTCVTFDRSIERIKRAGYERNLYPWEAFELILKGIDEPEGIYGNIAQDMMKGNAEWMNIAFKKEKNLLYVAIDPENIEYGEQGYHIKNDEEIQCKNIETYAIDLYHELVDLRDLIRKNPSLVQRLWGSNAATIIEVLKNTEQGDWTTGLWIEEYNRWQPVYLGDSYYTTNQLILHSGGKQDIQASRGVRVVLQKTR
jgi:hypothetical protein